MSYPDYKTYEKLYKRFLLGDRSEQMLDLAGDIKGKVFMDICAGGGRLTKEAIKRGTSYNIVIEPEDQMFLRALYYKHSDKIGHYVQKAHIALLSMQADGYKADVAICQQGINYWLEPKYAKSLSLTMSPGGIFIFNTFNQKPSKIPKVREYVMLGQRSKENHYVEISWFATGSWWDVNHVQICDGLPSHTTQFKWMDDEYIRNSLEKYFTIELIKDGKTSIYKCIRKD